MKQTNRVRVKRLVAIGAAAAAVMSLSLAAYAADVGGIQRTIQLWIDGDQTDAVLNIQDGNYTITIPDEDDDAREISGGGEAIRAYGSERPLTEEEIMEHLDEPEVEYREDGSVWVYYHDTRSEITDRFDEDGVCYLQVQSDRGVLYLTVKYGNGYASSPHKYLSPDSFNTSSD